MELAVQDIRTIFKAPHLDIAFCEELIYLLSTYGDVFNISTRYEVVRFLTQAVSETQVRSNGTVRIRENLNYSYKALGKLFSTFRRNKGLATKYGRTINHRANQVAIANLVYNDKYRTKRFKLGNVEEGDGWRFRGAGILQSTGRTNIVKDIDVVHELTPFIIADNYELFDDYRSFILLGMGHWHRRSMFKCKSTLCVTNLINRGLPKSYKDKRRVTAVRTWQYLRSVYA